MLDLQHCRTEKVHKRLLSATSKELHELNEFKWGFLVLVMKSFAAYNRPEKDVLHFINGMITLGIDLSKPVRENILSVH